MGTKKDGDTCWDHAHPDEPLFVLRAQDPSAPRVVLHWISKNFDNAVCPDAKLRDAFEQALRMREWHPKKPAD